MLSNRLSLVCGVGMATITVYYYWTTYRRPHHSTADDDEPTLGDRFWRCIHAIRSVTIGGTGASGAGDWPVFKVRRSLDTHYIRVPRHLVPQMIGHRGERVKELELRTGTAIHFANEFETTGAAIETAINGSATATGVGDGPNGTVAADASDDWGECDGGGEQQLQVPKRSVIRRTDYRVMAIRGEPDCIRAATDAVEALIADNAYDRVDIPYGCNIVGPNGERIQEIQMKSGARLKVEGSRYAKHRVLVVMGTAAQRAMAQELVQEVINEFNTDCEDI